MSEPDYDSPLINNLNAQMRCGILTSANGEILIIHDRQINGTPEYVEYDPQEQTFSIIYDDGKIQDLGLKFNNKIKDNLLHGSEVTLALLQDKVIKASQKLIFLIRDI